MQISFQNSQFEITLAKNIHREQKRQSLIETIEEKLVCPSDTKNYEVLKIKPNKKSKQTKIVLN